MSRLQIDIPYEKINLLLPQQKSKYSVLYNVFNDLFLGLKKIGINSEITLVKYNDYFSDFPYFNVRNQKLNDLSEIIYSNQEEFFITVDDFALMQYFFKKNIKFTNLLIWANYFYGHKFIFGRYTKLWETNFSIPQIYKLISFTPLNLIMRNARFYYEPMKNNITVAQSIWTDLLLERVYNIFTRGLLYIPLEYDYYNIGKVERIKKALIYLGSNEDTDLFALNKIINLLREEDRELEFDYFGDSDIGEYFNRRFGKDIVYLGKLERKNLSIEYARHLVTISPIYNGNFEMVPIQSLLCGTPVVTYIQPFMEVTGQSTLIANISNYSEVRRKFKMWHKAVDAESNLLREKILSVMDNSIVARELVNYLL